jgi:hypothetical protein
VDRGTIIRDGATGGLEQPVVSEKLAPAGPYRSARWLSTVLTALLTVDVVFALAGSVADFQMIQALESGGALFTPEDAAAYDRLSLAGGLQAGAAALTAIFFIAWLRRVYRNLGSLGTRWLRFRAGWAVWGWFVPFLSFARPKSIANDVWRASDPGLPRRTQRPPDGAPVPPVLNWWWGTYLVGFADPLGFETGDESAATLDEWVGILRWGQGADLVLAAAGVLAILVVRRTTARQDQRHAALTAAGGPIPEGL